jgi:hypothetical protein
LTTDANPVQTRRKTQPESRDALSMGEPRVLVATEAGISIRSLGDISNTIGACYGTEGLILTEENLCPEFFDLRSGLAGELFQKFENYQLRLAIIAPAPERYGARFKELAREHRSHNRIRIVDSRDEADTWLAVRAGTETPT